MSRKIGTLPGLPASSLMDGAPEPGARKYHYVLTRQWTPRSGAVVTGSLEGFLWLRPNASRIEVIEYLKGLDDGAANGMQGPGAILFFALEPDVVFTLADTPEGDR